ncbi:hypothetical protein ACJMK2_030748 [Sinanodonta woodiana]|uniref:Methyltransferase domain-containing protein n=1 Tax=Sinanodonta woodiana TaxID=1069815 RepID=A0ABD3X041_SINWO
MLKTMEKSEFNGYLMNMFASGFTSLAIAIGRETGLFEVLCKADSAMTCKEIAEATKLKERYVKEWLGCMTSADIVLLDAQAQKYQVPINYREGLLHGTGMSSGLVCWARRFDLLKEVLATDGPHGISYSADPKFFDWLHSFREQRKDYIVGMDVLPVIEELGMKQKLESGIKVVDIGCGPASISCAIAKHFPNSTFIGLEYDEAAVEKARDNIHKNGLCNISIEQGDALNLPESWTEQFDWVFVYDVMHDLPDPRRAMTEIRRILKADGICFLFEINAHSMHADNVGNKATAMLYAASMFVCLPSSMSQPPHIGYGACWGIEECEKALVESNLNVIMKKPTNDNIEYLFVCTR